MRVPGAPLEGGPTPGARGSPAEPLRGVRGVWHAGDAFAENTCCTQDARISAATVVNYSNFITALSQKRLLERDFYK